MSGIQGYVTAFRTCPRVRPLLRLFRLVQALGDQAVSLHFYLVTKNLKSYLNFSTCYINIQGTYLFSYYKPQLFVYLWSHLNQQIWYKKILSPEAGQRSDRFDIPKMVLTERQIVFLCLVCMYHFPPCITCLLFFNFLVQAVSPSGVAPASPVKLARTMASVCVSPCWSALVGHSSGQSLLAWGSPCGSVMASK